MLNSLLSFLYRAKSLDDINVVYRDELASKKRFSNLKKHKISAVTDYFEHSEVLIKRRLENNGKFCGGRSGYGTGVAEEKGVASIRVKVKMTKKEAARMLSKCKNGGVIDFKDVACELTQIPTGRVTIESSPAADTFHVVGAALKSIPEEL